MTSQPASVLGVIEDFQALAVPDRLELLLEFSENLPQLPDRYLEHPDLLERVEECQAPVYLFVEVPDPSAVHLFFSAPAEAPRPGVSHRYFTRHSMGSVRKRCLILILYSPMRSVSQRPSPP